MNTVFEGINNAALSLLAAQTPGDVYKAIIKEAAKLVHAHHGSIFLKNGRKLERVYTTWPKLYSHIPRRNGFTNRALTTREVVIVDDEEMAQVHPNLVRRGVKSFVVIPLTYHRKTIGVLSLQSFKKDTFTSNESHLLKLFGSVATLAIEKSKSFRDMQETIEMRDLFISMAAHELRTPLATINGYVQLLQTRLGNADNTEGRWATELRWEAGRLTKLVNELLEVSQIRAKKLNYTFEVLNIEDVLQKAISEFKFTYPERTVVFINSLHPDEKHLVGDMMKLIQVFVNLLNNSAKYSKEGTDIEIILTNKSEEIVVEVHDKGKGIPKNELEHVFDGFYKGKNDRASGLGLGLYIAKNIVISHKGDIIISSRINRGTNVRITLPVYISDERTTDESRSQSHSDDAAGSADRSASKSGSIHSTASI